MTSTTLQRLQEEEVALIIGSVVVALVICLGRVWIAAALGVTTGFTFAGYPDPPKT